MQTGNETCMPTHDGGEKLVATKSELFAGMNDTTMINEVMCSRCE